MPFDNLKQRQDLWWYFITNRKNFDRYANACDCAYCREVREDWNRFFTRTWSLESPYFISNINLLI